MMVVMVATMALGKVNANALHEDHQGMVKFHTESQLSPVANSKVSMVPTLLNG